MVSLNMYFEPEHTQKNKEVTQKSVKKIQMCILHQMRYLDAEYNFILEYDVCIGKISVFMTHGF